MCAAKARFLAANQYMRAIKADHPPQWYEVTQILMQPFENAKASHDPQGQIDRYETQVGIMVIDHYCVFLCFSGLVPIHLFSVTD